MVVAVAEFRDSHDGKPFVGEAGVGGGGFGAGFAVNGVTSPPFMSSDAPSEALASSSQESATRCRGLVPGWRLRLGVFPVVFGGLIDNVAIFGSMLVFLMTEWQILNPLSMYA